LIFQPSEESNYPGLFEDGSIKSGGERVVESGAMDDVDAALGLHVHPLLKAGKNRLYYRAGIGRRRFL